MKRRLATVIGLVVAAFMVAVIAQSNAAGEWNITATGAQGTTTSTMTLEQDGETLTGTPNLAEGGSMPLKGMISGNAVNFSGELDAGGTPIELVVTGTLDGDELTGTYEMGEFDSGDYTATRTQ